MAHARSIGLALVIGEAYADFGRLLLKHCTVDYTVESKMARVLVEAGKFFPILITDEHSLAEYFDNRNTCHILCPACEAEVNSTITHEWAMIIHRAMNSLY